jgi:lysozyme family protein
MDERFLSIVASTIKKEGGYVNDPTDRGGETKYGISKRSYPNLDIAGLSASDAMEIYFRDFWVKPGIKAISDDRVAAKIFDLAVNMGHVAAITILQRAANVFGFGLSEDGRIGERTLSAVNRFRYVNALIIAINMLAAQRYLTLGQPKFLAGWLERLGS